MKETKSFDEAGSVIPTANPKRGILLLAVFVIFLILLACLTSSVGNRGPKARILDSRFRVFTAAVTKGPTYTVYAGNQLEGQVRDRLRRWGIPIKAMPKSMLGVATNSYAFFVYYDLSSFPSDIGRGALAADLLDENGGVMPLRWFAGGVHSVNRISGAALSSPRICWSGWSLDSSPDITKNYILRLKLHSTNAALAEITIGKLQQK